MTSYTLRKGAPEKTRADVVVIGVVRTPKGLQAAPGGEGVASAYDEVRRVRKATAYLHSSARVIDIDGSNHPAGR